LKKLFSVVSIAVLLMNSMGYYALFWGLQAHHDKRLTNLLDSDSYDEQKAITIKIPVAIPYMMDQPDFTRTDGKFLHEDKYYRIVKQRYSQDTLYVVCIRDTSSEKIQHTLSDYVSGLSDHPQDSGDASKAFGSVIKDFIAHSCQSSSSITGWAREVTEKIHSQSHYSIPGEPVIQPPEHC
jgi:hypothetical protein